MYKLQFQKLDTNRPNKLPAPYVIVRLYSVPLRTGMLYLTEQRGWDQTGDTGKG